jgi:LacI family transcriptional regulator
MKRIVKIGLLLEFGRAFGRRLCEGIASVALERDWELSLYSLGDVQRGAPEVDAFIARELDAKKASELKKLGKPIVNIYSDEPGAGLSTVDSDHAAIGRLAAEHFLDHRFTSFAFCGYEGTEFSDRRRDAFVRRLAQSGFSCHCHLAPRRVLSSSKTDVQKGEWFRLGPDYEQIRDWVRKLPKPVAVFCSHDLRAYQLALTCRKAGIEVPREVAILGVDNDVIVCSFSSPMLSSVDPDAFSVGRNAALTLARTIEAPSSGQTHILVPPKGVVMRPSTEIYPLDPPWLSEALVFIGRNAANRLTSADVGRHLGLSHTPIDRAFRTVLGTSVQKEIIRVRLESAAHLLETTTLPISDVARQSGFSRMEYFCTCFRGRFGVRPSDYRRS